MAPPTPISRLFLPCSCGLALSPLRSLRFSDHSAKVEVEGRRGAVAAADEGSPHLISFDLSRDRGPSSRHILAHRQRLSCIKTRNISFLIRTIMSRGSCYLSNPLVAFTCVIVELRMLLPPFPLKLGTSAHSLCCPKTEGFRVPIRKSAEPSSGGGGLGLHMIKGTT